jgi:hypothetical protein
VSVREELRVLVVALAAVASCGGQPRANPESAPGTDSALPATAQQFLSTLNGSQRRTALFAFDDQERGKWAYVPQARAGLPLKSMDPAQREAAFTLLSTGLSQRGVGLARGIIELEGILGRLEGTMSNLVMSRDPELYFTSIFAGPAGTQPWGWRFEGHHLSVNVTELGPHGQIVAPLFMGANPARVPNGPKQGHRVLAAEEDVAFEMIQMLDASQRARATISSQTFGEIVTRSDPTVRPLALAGLPAAEMTPAQQSQLRKLLGVYAGRMSDSAAARQLRRIDEVGFGRLHFAWAGSHRPGNAHYYRMHGPTVLVEYDNTQGGANHIHTVWRDLENDFGGDLLKRHYSRAPHRP